MTLIGNRIFFPQTSSIRAFSKTSLYSILAHWGQWTYHRKISLSRFFILVIHTTFINAYNSTLPVHMLCKAIENLKLQARKDPIDMWKLHFILLSNCKEQATITKLMNAKISMSITLLIWLHVCLAFYHMQSMTTESNTTLESLTEYMLNSELWFHQYCKRVTV